MFLKIKKYLFLDDIFNMCSLTCYLFFFSLFYSINLMFYFSRLNMLIYTYLSVFQVLFLGVINDFLFIY